ncbi:hypothetical protein ABTY61_39780 [Kitasatospora sp. NPDC096128]|uniref:hypothetical protein n=1 Tax=Kitasatospora sp. NPDC096128 TaxID=3155547 RepID=UPI003321758A
MSAVMVAGLSAALVTGCSSGSSPASDQATQSVAVTRQPAAPSGQAAPIEAKGDGSGTLTLSGNHGVFKFDSVSCAGSRDVSGKLVATAGSKDDEKVSAILSFGGDGKFNLLLTNGDEATPVLWAGEASTGATASRTLDTVTLNALPVTAATMAGETDGITASGKLTCGSTDALL